MNTPTALLAFLPVATMLALLPGLDTALVLRTAAVEGARAGFVAGVGVVCGVLAWGLITALGLGAVLALSTVAHTALQWAGALYLMWMGGQCLRQALRPAANRSAALTTDSSITALRSSDSGSQLQAHPAPLRQSFQRGLLTNLLNPKVGLFYVGFLPQFLPDDVSATAFSVLLAAIHAVISLGWFALLVLATQAVGAWLRRPATLRVIDGLTGTLLLTLSLRLFFTPLRHTAPG